MKGTLAGLCPISCSQTPEDCDTKSVKNKESKGEDGNDSLGETKYCSKTSGEFCEAQRVQLLWGHWDISWILCGILLHDVSYFSIFLN